ncbi:hypothetical protein AYI70_g8259 [Smittium culicis]|uniref:Uncharacterized protein n=1 Tax=Smittium culicis TaxID=133412 RepID=A0A1R1XGT1_9FUNG|nr:hypothetical protein AYI70_g8259 [Smittium culicis]
MNEAKMTKKIDHISYPGLMNTPNYTKILKCVDLSNHLTDITEWNIEDPDTLKALRKFNMELIKELGELLNEA